MGNHTRLMRTIFIAALTIYLLSPALAQQERKPLLLQEMTWTDVKDYLKTGDMVIIPLGSTEQHGPHMPLGTDYYEATGMSKMISERTRVVVAPVLFSGYSEYHSGFAGSLSLRPETMEQVLFESAQWLIKHGFRRIMFFNYHGGNRVVEMNVIHRINHTSEAIAVAIGAGAGFQRGGEGVEGVDFDEHAGINETSMMLYLKPELVKMERAEKPKLKFSPLMGKLMMMSQKYPELGVILGSLLAVPVETKKGGASHEISSNGIWSTGDPKRATKDRGERVVRRMVDRAVTFIEAWKKVDG